tara:strand:+ start:2174 stop:2476 length:303 start_codon:yes stop_codon:yes gene_type:complete
MAQFKRYPGENPMVASRRIANNRRRSQLGMSPGGNIPKPISRPKPNFGQNVRPNIRPMPTNNSVMPRRNTPSPMYGGPRNMNTPSTGNVLTGRFKNKKRY